MRFRNLEKLTKIFFACHEILYAGYTPAMESFVQKNIEPVTRVFMELLKKLSSSVNLGEAGVRTKIVEFQNELLNAAPTSELGKIRQNFTKVSHLISPVPALIKHQAFREERETRVLVWPATNDEATHLKGLIKYLANSSIEAVS
jgi:hypothetical protein